ncbi:segregation and condensation protein A [Peptacetobacter hominis]|uniref:Segregation and condensation protein A n=1 Tax=Peptacetobacter hominis TaxID=2743610 RepID=A0A544QTY0_9FIRM|nr:segregation/condensation protein A [Peptacetobacter hominis]TQQ84137.1 segregation and condensation protein A [Peptacetobacter hominis]
MKYNVQIKAYEGPMDLLYDLVTKHKIDIKDISISEITAQYIDYLSQMEKMDMEITSDFIAMASKLLEIKSRYLLYIQRENEEDEDPRLELVEKLEEYRKYKQASVELKDKCSKIYERFYRKREEVITEEKLNTDDISVELMMEYLPKLLKRIEDKKEEQAVTDDVKRLVSKKVFSVEEKIVYIRSILNEKKEVSFMDTIKDGTKDEVIATFLSILELIKEREIKVEQDTFFDDIIIIRNMEC